MKRHLYTILFFLFTIFLTAQEKINIIPATNNIELHKGNFTLNSSSTVAINSNQLKDIRYYLTNEILENTGISIITTDKTNRADITLELSEKDQNEGYYELTINNNQVNIKAGTLSGMMNGASSLLQLITINKAKTNKISIPNLSIKEKPKYAWRGLMLDTSRYFISKDKLKEVINWMAFYKLNKLHLHLTDEPAWRLEIKKYPKLTSVGGTGNYNNPDAPAKYYTQKDINELVNYASIRQIEVIPEIDMPGHATAANRAYPEYSGGGSEKHPEFTFNPGKESTYAFLTDILRETSILFPAQMLHLGGDEVSFGSEKWKSNPKIQSLVKKESLTNLKDIENYFMERMADSVFKLNSKLIAWDELADSDLPRDKTILMWWRHDKPEQLNKSIDNGFKTIVCPRVPFYFDFIQDEAHQSGRKWAGEYSTLERIYNFNISKLINNKENEKNIIGFQGNLWTETITSDKRLEFMIFPRIAALAETAWTENRNDYTNFQQRLKMHLPVYKTEDIYFFDPFNPDITPEPLYNKTK